MDPNFPGPNVYTIDVIDKYVSIGINPNLVSTGQIIKNMETCKEDGSLHHILKANGKLLLQVSENGQYVLMSIPQDSPLIRILQNCGASNISSIIWLTLSCEFAAQLGFLSPNSRPKCRDIKLKAHGLACTHGKHRDKFNLSNRTSPREFECRLTVTVSFDQKGGDMKCHALIDQNGKRCEYAIDKDDTCVLPDPIGSGMASRIYHQVHGGGNSISVVTSFTILPKPFEEVTKALRADADPKKKKIR
jgi:hypothetical protein